jgi:geranylgeranyl pyrophosphate synthase
MAFQMIDDLDDMLDSPQHSYDCDLRNGYLALPLIRVLDALKDGHREQLVRIIEKAEFTPATERYIVELCMEYGTLEQTHGAVDRHLERAGETLARFSPSPSRELLGGIVTELRAYAAEQTRNFAEFLRNSA